MKKKEFIQWKLKTWKNEMKRKGSTEEEGTGQMLQKQGLKHNAIITITIFLGRNRKMLMML